MRFIIITLPPRPVREDIEALRRPLNAKVGSSQALRYPPHVTLRTGLVCPDERAGEVAQSFLAYAAQFTPVPVQTNGVFFTTYGPGEAPRGLVGCSVELSPSLEGLHRGLLGFREWQKGPQGPYRPHVTLAFEDLSAEGVEILRHEIASASRPWHELEWTVDNVALYYEQPEGWVPWDSVPLKSFSRP